MNFNDTSKGIVCFLRHGQTDWNIQQRMQGREEVPLNETGIKQAQEAAAGFKEALDKASISWDKIISSPLGRAKTTAKIIADAVGCRYFGSDERLTERDFGELSGLEYDNYSKAVFNSVPEIATVETIESLLARANEFIHDNVKSGERVLVVTHGAITRIFARNSKRIESIPDDFDDAIGNCHCVLYTYDGEKTVMQAYNISPNEIVNYATEE